MELKELEEKIRTCKECPLYKERTNAVPGEGSPNAKVMFIGEAPGENEDLQGRPFVGRAGMLLNEMLEKVGIKRNEVYITNVVKCRPPNNRDPEEDEIRICTSLFLKHQIEIINPKVIVGLGRFSSKYLFDSYGLEFPGISKVHGKAYKIDNLYHHLVIFPIYHPAAAIYNQALKRALEIDFVELSKII
ncbi:MAG: type-4 uracil-DNA glycosylase [Candidatus Micrarchaeia archaeon]